MTNIARRRPLFVLVTPTKHGTSEEASIRPRPLAATHRRRAPGLAVRARLVPSPASRPSSRDRSNPPAARREAEPIVGVFKRGAPAVAPEGKARAPPVVVMADERWHDAVKKVAEVSNRERFEKLKESRAKYKEEAARQRAEAEAAASRCETLERQLQMLVAQVESSAASEAEAEASAGAGARDDAADVAALENEVRRLHAVIAAGRQETLIMHEDDVGGAADARPLAVEQSAAAVDADAMPDHEEDKITIKRLQVRVCRLATLATRNNTHKRTHAHAHMLFRCSCGKHANGRRSFVTSCCASVPAFAPKATSTRACATPSRARSKQPEKACPSTPLSRTCCPVRSWRLRFDRPRPTALQTGMPRLRKATSSCRPE